MVDWNRYPKITDRKQAQHWLQIQENLGLAHNTIDAYARALEDYFQSL